MKNETKSLMPYAAVNCHEIGLHEYISQSFEQALQTRSELCLYALVDSAFNEKLIKRYKANHPSVQPVALYAETELEELTDISPVLIPLSSDSDMRNASIRMLLQLADGMPMLSFRNRSPCPNDEELIMNWTVNYTGISEGALPCPQCA